ncbi:hypothetical protein LNKW23_40570 [Paralimibaculum aggregatum]|uniref:Glycosyltransferase 2-like domain-containing protein n=1 Tax=Paralimibaculum aggregatum TaxID=3036245 RepID=A0ABQ6LNQ3_9RHOB|nr:glycosyltransferase [Limibaculum sp. NKW23]GMG84841.1 hypothetical protein LNKW23_40570 [Limibaculum sp. NKW23]
MTRLSVVIPVYNGAATLGRTLGSLDGQARLGEVEIVAVDQASGDGSREILERHAARLPLRVLDAPDCRNWMQTTNAGLRAARGPLVSMLHQDDIWLPGRVAAMLTLAERHPEAALWLHAAWFIDGQDRRLGRFSPPFGRRARLIDSETALATLLVQNTVALPAAMFRREAALARGGLSEDLWYTADWDLWLALARQGPVAWTPERLAGFRIHAGSQTVTGSRDLEDFAAQHQIPLARHGAALGGRRGRQARALGAAAAGINLALVSRLHGRPRPVWPLLGEILRLGPLGWGPLLVRSQILQRLVPRLRALRRRG